MSAVATLSRAAHVEYLLRLADNALVLGQQLGALVARGPELEEEMATANFALDYIGQARLLLSHAAELQGEGRTEDELAFLRDGFDFHNVLLVEQPSEHFGDVIVRQFLFDSFYCEQLRALTESTDARLAEIAARGVKEVGYHLHHTRQWVIRLGDGTDFSHNRVQESLDRLWRYTGELFDADATDRAASEAGVGPDPASLKLPWDAVIDATLEEATLVRPAEQWMDGGGKQGRHSEHLGHLLTDMQFLQRAYPGAQW